MVEVTENVTAISGSGATLTVTPQFSYDGSVWYDQSAKNSFTPFTATGIQTKQITQVAIHFRLKFVVAGTTPSVTHTYSIVAKNGGGGGVIENLPALDGSTADAEADTKDTLPTNTRLKAFNGTTWERVRSSIKTVVSSVVGFLNVLAYGVYNATPTVRTEGQAGPQQQDANGNLLVSLGTLISGENQSANRMRMSRPGIWTEMTTATTTTHLTGTGSFLGIYVQATLTGAVNAYDNTAGSGTRKLTLPVGTTPGFYGFPNGSASLNNGLTVVTAAADSIQVGYEPN